MSTRNVLEKFNLNSVVASFSTRADGNMSLCYGDIKNTLEDRRKFLSNLGIDYRDLICAKQVHGKNVEYVTQEHRGRGAKSYESSLTDTDGFITDQKNVPIAILIADCLPVFIYDPNRPAIAVLHAGWRSTEKNICAQGIREMQKKLASQPKNLFVGFGPSIRACCFEVKKDFKSNFAFGLINREGHTFMDLALINQRQLLDCGVKKSNIFDSEICTFSDSKNFFSFRKEAALSGRLISVMMLR